MEIPIILNKCCRIIKVLFLHKHRLFFLLRNNTKFQELDVEVKENLYEECQREYLSSKSRKIVVWIIYSIIIGVLAIIVYLYFSNLISYTQFFISKILLLCMCSLADHYSLLRVKDKMIKKAQSW